MVSSVDPVKLAPLRQRQRTQKRVVSDFQVCAEPSFTAANRFVHRLQVLVERGESRIRRKTAGTGE